MTGQNPQAVLEALARDQHLRGYLHRGRLQIMPAKRSRRLALLEAVAQVFEPGIRYPEPAVNELLRAIYLDCEIGRAHV